MYPGRKQPLSRSFFADRVVRGQNTHMKSFASEMLAVISILSLFIQLVVVPAGAVPEHVAGCMWEKRLLVARVELTAG